MKLRLIIFLCVCLCIFKFSHLAFANNLLTIEDIKKYALANNFGVKAISQELNEAKAQTTQKRSSFFPNFSFIAGPEIQTYDSKSESSTMGYLSGEWNVFNGSRDRIELEISEFNEKIIEVEISKKQFELELEIENLFYLYLYKLSKFKYYKKSLELNLKHKKLINQKKFSGLASAADVMEFEIRDSILNSEINSLVQEMQETKLGLIRIMGQGLQTNFEPIGDLPHLHVEKQLSDFLSQINSTSGFIKKSSYLAAMGSLSLKQSRFSWIPKIDLQMKYGKLPMELSTQFPAFEGAFLLKWNFFSGFETTGKIAEAQARVNRLNYEFQQKLLDNMSDAEINYSKLISIQDRVHAEEGNELRAEKYYNVIINEYRQGVKNGADLKAAEELLLSSRIRNAELKYQFIDNKIKLEKSIGLRIDTVTQP